MAAVDLENMLLHRTALMTGETRPNLQVAESPFRSALRTAFNSSLESPTWSVSTLQSGKFYLRTHLMETAGILKLESQRATVPNQSSSPIQLREKRPEADSLSLS
jgi:hypothetical protein